MEINQLTGQIIGSAIEVHKELGPGLLEDVYEVCLAHELSLREIHFKRQLPLGIEYKGIRIDPAYRLDLLVSDRVVVELKTVDKILDIHKAQLLTYMKLGGWKIGLLINFRVPVLRDGIERFVR